MQRPDEETLRAIISLESDPRGKKILDWFGNSLDIAEKALHENTVFNAGRVAELADIVRNFVEAKKNLDDFLKARK